MKKKGETKNGHGICMQAFLSSKLNLRFWKVFLLDFLCVFSILFIVFVVFSYSIAGILSSIGNVGGLPSLMASDAQNIGGMQDFHDAFVGIALFFLVSLILGFLITMFFKSLSWKVAVEKKFFWNYYFKFIGLRMIFIILLGLISGFLFNGNIYLGIVGFVVSVFIANIYFLSLVNLAKSDDFTSSFEKGFAGWRLDKFFMLFAYFLLLIVIFLGINKLIYLGINVPDLSGLEAVGQNLQVYEELSLFFSLVFKRLFITLILWIFLNSYMKIFYSEYVSRMTF